MFYILALRPLSSLGISGYNFEEAFSNVLSKMVACTFHSDSKVQAPSFLPEQMVDICHPVSQLQAFLLHPTQLILFKHPITWHLQGSCPGGSPLQFHPMNQPLFSQTPLHLHSF